MNTRKTLALALLLAALVLYLNKVALPHRELAAGEKLALSRLKAEDISRIEVRRGAGSSDGIAAYTMVRAATTKDGSGVAASSMWTIEGMRGAKVDATVIGEFVSGLSGLSVEGPLDDKEAYADLSKYGLDKPELTTIVHQSDGISTEIAFGKENQYLQKRYVKVSGRGGIFLAEGAAFSTLNKSITDVRSKAPFDFKDDDVRRIVLSAEKSRVVVAQPVVGEWKILEPIASRASTEDVKALLSAVRGLSAQDFIDVSAEKRAQYGLANPRVTVELTFPEGAQPSHVVMTLSQPVKAASADPDVYVASSESDSILKLSSDPVAAFTRGVNDLRFKEVVAMPSSAMEKVVSSGSADAGVTIASAGIGWTVNGKESDPSFVEQFLNDVSGLKAVAFPEKVPEDAFADPFVSLVITKKGEGAEQVTVTVGKEFKGESGETLRYVRSSASDVVLGIRDVEAKRIVPHEEMLLPPKTPTPKASETPKGSS
jgi:hypothetical protein